MSNTYGHLFKVTSFGESHGDGLGVIIDGMPSGIKVNESVLEDFLERRRPGGKLVSSRKELDAPQVLSGVLEGETLGTPISCIFKNVDARSKDYKDLEDRRGHADSVWKEKYQTVDLRGGGRSSGRETLARVVAGAFAKMALREEFPDLDVRAVTRSIFNFEDDKYTDDDFFKKEKTQLGFLDEKVSEKAAESLLKAKEEGESFGGKVEVRVQNPISSLGQPVFGKIKSKLAEAIMSIGAVKSFSLGEEVDFKECAGKEFHSMDQSVYGGVLGGITTGETIQFFAEVKPTSSILDVAKVGRHDPCIVPRVLVVLESMVWIVLMDMWLQRKSELKRK
ncbi:MAG: chorismate synthase [Bdellovibrionales bacterium]